MVFQPPANHAKGHFQYLVIACHVHDLPVTFSVMLHGAHSAGALFSNRIDIHHSVTGPLQ